MKGDNELRFSVESKKCIMCGACVNACPTDMVREKRGTIKIGRVACIDCGHCMAICPTGAVRLEQIDYDGEFSVIPEKVAGSQELLGLMKSRRTVRRFLSEQISQEDMDMMLEAAQYVASGANCQCQRFTVLMDEAMKSHLRKDIMAFYRGYAVALADKENPERLAEFLGESGGEMHEHIVAAVPALVKNVDSGRDRLFFGAPVVILIHADRNEVLPASTCALAANHITLMAHSLGLGSCITAYASLALAQLPELRAEMGIDAEDDVYYVVVLGKAADTYHLVPPRHPVDVRYV